MVLKYEGQAVGFRFVRPSRFSPGRSLSLTALMSFTRVTKKKIQARSGNGAKRPVQ